MTTGDDGDDLSADPLGPDVGAALSHIVAARLLNTPRPPRPHKVSQLFKPYKMHWVKWRRDVAFGSTALTVVSLILMYIPFPWVAVPAVLSVLAGIALATLVITELLVGCGVEWEEQFVTPGEKPRYDRYNFFIPSIRSLPRLIALLAASTAGIVVGFGGIFSAIQVHNPGAFSSHTGAWIYFSMVTFATVGYGDIAPVSALARGTVVCEIGTALAFNAVVLSSTISWLISDARLRRDAADRQRGKRMQRREEWMKRAKLGLYAEPGENDKLVAAAEAMNKPDADDAGGAGQPGVAADAAAPRGRTR
jgi:hypothetical protein